MRRLALGAALFALSPAPAQAATSLWGYGGLIGVPDARTASPRALEVGANWVASPGVPWFPSLEGTALTGFVRVGVLDGLELSAAYGLPSYAWPTAAVKWRIVHVAKPWPNAIALGISQIGVPQGSLSDPMALYAVLTSELPFGVATLGVEGDSSLAARVLVGLETPLGKVGRLIASGHGPGGTASADADLGAEVSVWPGVRLAASTVSRPGGSLVAHGLSLGASARIQLPEPAPMPARTPEPVPAAPPASTRTPLPGGTLPPPSLPAATIVVRVVSAQGAPLAAYLVRLEGLDRSARTTRAGYCFFGGLSPGHYALAVEDPAGHTVATGQVDPAVTGPLTVTLTASADPGRTP